MTTPTPYQETADHVLHFVPRGCLFYQLITNCTDIAVTDHMLSPTDFNFNANINHRCTTTPLQPFKSHSILTPHSFYTLQGHLQAVLSFVLPNCWFKFHRLLFNVTLLAKISHKRHRDQIHMIQPGHKGLAW